MSSGSRLADVGELGLLMELERRGLAVGIENDAAELAGGRVVTQDVLVESVHFRLDWITWHELGFRAAAVNLSDLAASGATPEGLVVTLAAPSDTAVADVVELYEGLAEAGTPVIGGDTSAADRLVLSVTAIGRSERVPGRAGARPGDVLVVTGPLGAAGAAFRRGGYVRPPLRLEEGRELARTAHALIDLSDGLARDAGHIAARSGCRLVVELERVPLADGAESSDLGFGEDYELLAALPDGSAAFPEIGRCEEGEGVELRLHGNRVELGSFEHFAGDGGTEDD
jgi:thiamine-monophosphate kinase